MGMVVAVIILGLLVFVEPSLDGLAGYLLIHDGHKMFGVIVLLVNAVIVAGALSSFLPERFRPPGAEVLATVIVRNDVNVWLGLVALGYSLVVRDWLPALILVASVVLLAIGSRGVVAWLSSWRA